MHEILIPKVLANRDCHRVSGHMPESELLTFTNRDKTEFAEQSSGPKVKKLFAEHEIHPAHKC